MDTKSGEIKNEAFYLRSGEDYLSANWIEYYSQDQESAMNAIRDGGIPVTISEGDKFVVLNVGDSIDSIKEGGGESPSVLFCPDLCSERKNPSHVAIAWDEMAQTQQMVASELLALIQSHPESVYPGKIK